ncbi:AsmA family protein [Phaeobacter gallaeciensis]|uniref:AsmA family protein n=1 Tax=Phaeobacter gallaeciensis TaxID=60890 RepID=UPI00237FC56E|nr:AsmA family protein [Phaeobacter gallaeciensis]MDE4191702.1 AsmA family protein [Phaeobacter gallaeciensis]MDE4200165.1 AsmA family protein [Phaeobacter gallaeciensis]MDE4204387.1 AsmA family protein [Phaeobacter gallaeciensis]MDE4208457.1 AsmA family protein [Phaeobacter gallaeciensis]MDE4216896.1 AsmA family protein [Phaeobacter gallaeciensis]
MRLIIRVLSAILLTLAVLIGLVFMLPGEKVAALAAQQLEAQTGRKLEFQGEVGFSLWPVLGVRTEGVTLSNADWAGPEPMLRAARMSIGIAPADLLRGKVRVTEVTALLPHLNLSTRADGTGNWVMSREGTPGADTDATPQEGSDLAVQIEKLTMTGASLRYAPHGGTPVEMKAIDLALSWPDPGGTVDMEMTLRPVEAPVQVKAEIGTFAEFLTGRVSSVGGTVSGPGGVLMFDGRAGIDGAGSGRVTLKTTDSAGFIAALGGGEVSLPKGLGQAAVVGADATYTPDGRLALRDLSLDLDGNTLQGAADLVMADVPEVTAQLSAGALSFPGLDSPVESSGSGAGSAPDGWPKEQIDASALSAFNGTAVLTFQSLSAAGYNLGESKLTFSLDRARAVLKAQPATMFGGQVTGQVVANNRNGLSVGGKLSFNDIQLEQALGQTAGYDRLHGAALGEIEYLGVGNSVDAIMRSLSGKGWLEAGKGFFTGFDLEDLMRSGSGNGGSTVFEQLTGSYTIANGNLQNEDLLVIIKGLRAEGAGRIGLGARDLDYRFTPTLQGADGGAGLSIPVAITGSWSAPKIRPDLKSALQPQIDEIEQEAKDRVREKLSEELETEIAPEQDLNEVIKDRIEQEAKDQLLRLLQGN